MGSNLWMVLFLVPQAANHTAVLLGPGDYTMEQCQVAEWTAKKVHSNGQQSKNGLPTVPSEAAQYPYTLRKMPQICTYVCRYSRCRSKNIASNTLAEPTLAGRLNTTVVAARPTATTAMAVTAATTTRPWPIVLAVHGVYQPAEYGPTSPVLNAPGPRRAMLGGCQTGCALLSAAKIPGTAAWRGGRGRSRVRTGAKTSDQGD